MHKVEPKFKKFGVIACKPCATKWKAALQKKGKQVRVRKTDEGYEVKAR